MNGSRRLLGLFLVASMPACIEFPEIPELEAGMEGGPCVEGQCLGDLICIQGTCGVDPDDEDDPTATSGIDPDPDDDDASGSSSMTGPDDGSAGDPTGQDPTGDDSDSGDETTGPLWSTGDDTMGDDTMGDDTQGDPTDSGDTGVGFISDPDGPSIECSIWQQDCPVGEKCVAWANDGGNNWNATRCAPIDPFPRQVGQSCFVEGSGVSGIDNCVEGAMCWDVEPETNEGTCVAFCEGTENNPQCGAGLTCAIANSDVLALCLPGCDPILQDCGFGEGCYGIDNSFVCAPDASGGFGSYGESCESINACESGLACISAALVPGCSGFVGCCSDFCDLNDFNNPCPGAGGGQECVAWFEEGAAPPGYEDVGVCGIPS